MRSWVLLAAFGILGMAATVPWGAIVGAAIKTPIGLMLPILGVYGLLIVSGVFFPITVFPVYPATLTFTPAQLGAEPRFTIRDLHSATYGPTA